MTDLIDDGLELSRLLITLTLKIKVEVGESIYQDIIPIKLGAQTE